MVYKPAKLPAVEDKSAQAIAGYLEDELHSLSHEMTNNVKEQKINPSHVAPTKPRVGTIVYADGTDWNPGNGEGLYVYDSAGNWIWLEAPVVADPFPVFGVRLSSDQTGIANSTFTKVNWNAVDFDSDSWWDGTNHRYRPLRAGYYLFTATANDVASTGAITGFIVSLYKNGTEYSRLINTNVGSAAVGGGSVVMHMNGSTDYVEIFVFITAATTRAIDATVNNIPRFTGAMVRDD